MGEDKPGRLFKREETLLVFENQVVRVNIISFATFHLGRVHRGIDHPPALFVNGEVAVVDVVDLVDRSTCTVLLVVLIFCENPLFNSISILLLKHFGVFTALLASIGVYTVLGNLVNEEESQDFDSLVVKDLFFL